MAQMTKIKVDGVERDVDSSLTYAALSEQLKAEHSPSRVIVEIFQDEKPISLGEEDQLRFQLVRDLKSLAFVTKDVTMLFRESLGLAPKICEAMALDIEDIDGFFQAGDFRQAQERVGELTSLVEWLLELISGIQALGDTKIEDLTFSQGGVMDAVQRMNRELVSLHSEMAAQQWDAFRTRLKGSFCAEVQVWRALFTDVASTWNPSAVVRSGGGAS